VVRICDWQGDREVWFPKVPGTYSGAGAVGDIQRASVAHLVKVVGCVGCEVVLKCGPETIIEVGVWRCLQSGKDSFAPTIGYGDPAAVKEFCAY